MKWSTQAPSNIALIKYMGKTNAAENQPINASFSYTLDHLQTRIELELSTTDKWEPLITENFIIPALSPTQQDRFLRHLKVIKNYFGSTENFIVRSANNFPLSCGLASSASSFSALTQVAAQALSELTQK